MLKVVVFLFGLNYVCGPVNITSFNSLNGHNLFLEGTKGTLLCTISKWKERISWLVDKDKVAECIGTICTQISTGFGMYSFGFNIPNSTEFSFLVSSALRGRVVTCFDGESSDAIKVDVKGPGAGFRGDSTVTGLIIVSGLLAAVVIYVLYRDRKGIIDLINYLRGRRSTEDEENQRSTSKGNKDERESNLPLLSKNKSDKDR